MHGWVEVYNFSCLYCTQHVFLINDLSLLTFISEVSEYFVYLCISKWSNNLQARNQSGSRMYEHKIVFKTQFCVLGHFIGLIECWQIYEPLILQKIRIWRLCQYLLLVMILLILFMIFFKLHVTSYQKVEKHIQ